MILWCRATMMVRVSAIAEENEPGSRLRLIRCRPADEVTEEPSQTYRQAMLKR